MVALTQIRTSPRSPAPTDRHRTAAVPTVVGLAPGEPLHAHLIAHDEETTVSVVEGVVYATVEEHDYVVLPGDRITLPAGGPHRIWNAGDEIARLIAERRPR
jgi:quercetin dioxygenase-like cupin family protein